MQSNRVFRSEPRLSLPSRTPFRRSLAGLHNTPLSCADFHTYLLNPNPPTLTHSKRSQKQPGRCTYAPNPRTHHQKEGSAHCLLNERTDRQPESGNQLGLKRKGQ